MFKRTADQTGQIVAEETAGTYESMVRNYTGAWQQNYSDHMTIVRWSQHPIHLVLVDSSSGAQYAQFFGIEQPFGPYLIAPGLYDDLARANIRVDWELTQRLGESRSVQSEETADVIAAYCDRLRRLAGEIA
jgi:hypothetical protein